MNEHSRTHAIELTVAHLNTLSRMVSGADSITVDRFGGVRIQGKAPRLDGAPEALGLERHAKEDHSSATATFSVWRGDTTSAFGTFETTISLVGPVRQAIPADCDSASFS